MKMFKISCYILTLLLGLIMSKAWAIDSVASLPVFKVMQDDVYLTVRPDLRRCVSPICGGWFVNAVNMNKLKCPDGSVRRECYVGTDQVSIADLSPDQLAILQQAMARSQVLIKGSLSNSVPYGLLDISAAWIAATDQQPTGKFVSITDNGIRCITHPCESFDALVLNKKAIKSLAAYDLSGVNATVEQINQANEAISSAEGLHTAGHYIEVTGPAGTAQGIIASQFYLALKGEAPKACMPTGCSSQICADSPVITTCEWRPEYACYRTAECTTQANGECGWTMDAELVQCLNDASGGLLQ